MLNHTKKIKEIYEVIQKMIFYMIPEKWDKLYLYSSVIDMPEGKKTGELYFYYIPKGILRKKPVNVYEIPSKFNIDEEEYLKLVKALYQKIQQLREEFRKSETGGIWSNITITIENLKFKVEYNYEDLKKENEAGYTKLVCHCVRIAFELGADIIKTQFTGSAESFSKVVEAANGTPVLIAGGKMKDENELYAMVSDSIKAGGAGVSIGRNVFNREDSLEVIERLRKIVFD